MTVICDYCGQAANLVTGEVIYPHRRDLYHLKFWHCDNGHPSAYVGCHKPGNGQGDGDKPLGRLADKVLRKAKGNAHQSFDWLWQDGIMKRNDAYAWLAEQLGINQEDCNIGLMDVATCNRVVDLCMNKLEEHRNAKV